MCALGIGRRQALHDVAAKTNKSVFIRTKGKTMSEENDNKAVVGSQGLTRSTGFFVSVSSH